MDMNTMIEVMDLLAAGELDMAAVVASEHSTKGTKDVFSGLAKSAGYSAKEINQAWKKANPEKKAKKSIGILEEFRLWLSAETRTEQEAFDKTIEIGLRENSVSYIAYVTTRLDEWEMVERVIARLEGREAQPRTLKGLTRKQAQEMLDSADNNPEEEFYYDEDMSDEVKMAWDHLKAEMARAKPRKTKVHPDKVASLNDEALTEAYTKAFQELNTKKRK